MVFFTLPYVYPTPIDTFLKILYCNYSTASIIQCSALRAKTLPHPPPPQFNSSAITKIYKPSPHVLFSSHVFLCPN